jgi:hypothetical protein
MAETEGLYLLTATANDRVALAPEGSVFTVFTGLLLDVLRTGVPTDYAELSLDDVFRTVRARSSPELPVPQQWGHNSAGGLALVRNAAVSPGARASRPLDLAHSRAVLIGTATYRDRHLPPSPRSRRDIDWLREALLDASICGFRGDHCTALLDPSTPTAVVDILRAVGAEAHDHLVVYLSGCSWTIDGQLAFPVTESLIDDPDTMLTADQLAEAIAHTRSRSTVVIVDASFSARLFSAFSGLQNTALLTSSGQHQHARIDGGNGAFTAALLRLLDRGMTGRASHLTVLDLAQGLSASGGARGPYQPSLRVDRLQCLFHNRAEDVDHNAPHPCNPWLGFDRTQSALSER